MIIIASIIIIIIAIIIDKIIIIENDNEMTLEINEQDLHSQDNRPVEHQIGPVEESNQ